ncbi:hypothetical protein C8J57DRAFT_1510464 [Mycena rebaudengoi]|nr:hypothetical protein C8J57DRAFT_1510464 [Mycena rebaudengoi]
MPSVPRPGAAQWLHRILALIPNNPSHPAQVAIRTYCLSLCLSLGPSLIPFLKPGGSKRNAKNGLQRLLAREVGLSGFAFSITLVVGSGSLIREIWRALDEITFPDADGEVNTVTAAALKIRAWISVLKLSSAQKTFFSNVAAGTAGILLLKRGHWSSNRPSSTPPSESRTLELTLLLLVRAVDAAVQSFIAKQFVAVPNSLPTQITKAERDRRISLRQQTLRTRIDSFVFWACCARIVWCFFYEPKRLPKAYVRWLNGVAKLDVRLFSTLRSIRAGEWSYTKGLALHHNLLSDYSRDLGHPASWGDPSALPAYGGPRADQVWKQLGLTTRPGVGT